MRVSLVNIDNALANTRKYATARRNDLFGRVRSSVNVRTSAMRSSDRIFLPRPAIFFAKCARNLSITKILFQHFPRYAHRE